jgi:hypothetical protein
MKKKIHVSNSRGNAASQVPEGTMICPKMNGHCKNVLSSFIYKVTASRPGILELYAVPFKCIVDPLFRWTERCMHRGQARIGTHE